MTYGNRPDWYHQEKHVNENGYATELITDEAVQYIRKHKDSDHPLLPFPTLQRTPLRQRLGSPEPETDQYHASSGCGLKTRCQHSR